MALFGMVWILKVRRHLRSCQHCQEHVKTCHKCRGQGHDNDGNNSSSIDIDRPDECRVSEDSAGGGGGGPGGTIVTYTEASKPLLHCASVCPDNNIQQNVTLPPPPPLAAVNSPGVHHVTADCVGTSSGVTMAPNVTAQCDTSCFGVRSSPVSASVGMHAPNGYESAGNADSETSATSLGSISLDVVPHEFDSSNKRENDPNTSVEVHQNVIPTGVDMSSRPTSGYLLIPTRFQDSENSAVPHSDTLLHNVPTFVNSSLPGTQYQANNSLITPAVVSAVPTTLQVSHISTQNLQFVSSGIESVPSSVYTSESFIPSYPDVTTTALSTQTQNIYNTTVTPFVSTIIHPSCFSTSISQQPQISSLSSVNVQCSIPTNDSLTAIEVNTTANSVSSRLPGNVLSDLESSVPVSSGVWTNSSHLMTIGNTNTSHRTVIDTQHSKAVPKTADVSHSFVSSQTHEKLSAECLTESWQTQTLPRKSSSGLLSTTPLSRTLTLPRQHSMSSQENLSETNKLGSTKDLVSGEKLSKTRGSKSNISQTMAAHEPLFPLSIDRHGSLLTLDPRNLTIVRATGRSPRSSSKQSLQRSNSLHRVQSFGSSSFVSLESVPPPAPYDQGSWSYHRASKQEKEILANPQHRHPLPHLLPSLSRAKRMVSRSFSNLLTSDTSSSLAGNLSLVPPPPPAPSAKRIPFSADVMELPPPPPPPSSSIPLSERYRSSYLPGYFDQAATKPSFKSARPTQYATGVLAAPNSVTYSKSSAEAMFVNRQSCPANTGTSLPPAPLPPRPSYLKGLWFIPTQSHTTTFLGADLPFYPAARVPGRDKDRSALHPSWEYLSWEVNDAISERSSATNLSRLNSSNGKSAPDARLLENMRFMSGIPNVGHLAGSYNDKDTFVANLPADGATKNWIRPTAGNAASSMFHDALSSSDLLPPPPSQFVENVADPKTLDLDAAPKVDVTGTAKLPTLTRPNFQDQQSRNFCVLHSFKKKSGKVF